ncbi:hypothetical protein DFJ74DRAFT_737654 [Hyaloraphidium curvatum]|nr:hypothetical protein DFJ74DRAFT_737654 [Hyaloraphidium curvatum]
MALDDDEDVEVEDVPIRLAKRPSNRDRKTGQSISSNARAWERIDMLIASGKANYPGLITLDTKFLESLRDGQKNNGDRFSPVSILQYHSHACLLGRLVVAKKRGIARENTFLEVPTDDRDVQTYREWLRYYPIDRLWRTVERHTASFASQSVFAVTLQKLFTLLRGSPDHADPMFFGEKIKELAKLTKKQKALQLPQLSGSDLQVEYRLLRQKVESFARDVLTRYETASPDVVRRGLGDIQAATICAIYVLHPPSRSDYAFLRFTPTKNTNFYDGGEDCIVLNNFKTAASIGRTYVKVENELVRRLLHLLVDRIRSQDGDRYVFQSRPGKPFSTESGFGQHVGHCFKKVTGDALRPTSLRRLYISFHACGTVDESGEHCVPRAEENAVLARSMMHSAAQQATYRRQPSLQHIKSTLPVNDPIVPSTTTAAALDAVERMQAVQGGDSREQRLAWEQAKRDLVRKAVEIDEAREAAAKRHRERLHQRRLSN